MDVPGIEPDTLWHGLYVETPSRLVRTIHGAHDNQRRVVCTIIVLMVYLLEDCCVDEL